MSNNLSQSIKNVVGEVEKTIKCLGEADYKDAKKHAKRIKEKIKELEVTISNEVRDAMAEGARGIENELMGPIEEIKDFIDTVVQIADTVENTIAKDTKDVCKDIVTDCKQAFLNVEGKASDAVARIKKTEGTVLHDVQSIKAKLQNLHLESDISAVIKAVESELDSATLTAIKKLYTQHATESPDKSYGKNLSGAISQLHSDMALLLGSPQFKGLNMPIPSISTDLSIIESILDKLPDEAGAILEGILPIEELENISKSISQHVNNKAAVAAGPDKGSIDAIKVLIAASASLKAMSTILVAAKKIIPGTIAVKSTTSGQNSESAQGGADVAVTGTAKIAITEGGGGSVGVNILSITSGLIAPVSIILNGIAMAMDISCQILVIKVKEAAA